MAEAKSRRSSLKDYAWVVAMMVVVAVLVSRGRRRIAEHARPEDDRRTFVAEPVARSHGYLFRGR